MYFHLRQDIESGHFPEHTRLPSKRTMAMDLDVSLSTVEQALDLLEQEGYVETRERKGVFVSEGNRRNRPENFQMHLLAPDEKERSGFSFLALV
ncbi:GntR family transcriptional regulator [Allobaculum sp. Allo2]|uniref:GntR family transcriptional regulator n=1 Tax=Allobaculum sp. Allo2 TaxID=2853432 RepID=UPI002111A062|nr:winged helix-turn-helix domain-containing protein [Allobaculum sp. Allo2]UNT94415.1 winged helix-turn-helix domain-containing protein [Allobaculum sp. Allo2]